MAPKKYHCSFSLDTASVYFPFLVCSRTAFSGIVFSHKACFHNCCIFSHSFAVLLCCSSHYSFSCIHWFVLHYSIDSYFFPLFRFCFKFFFLLFPLPLPIFHFFPLLAPRSLIHLLSFGSNLIILFVSLVFILLNYSSNFPLILISLSPFLQIFQTLFILIFWFLVWLIIFSVAITIFQKLILTFRVYMVPTLWHLMRGTRCNLDKLNSFTFDSKIN